MSRVSGRRVWCARRRSVFAPEGRYLGDVLTPTILEIHHIGADFVVGRMASSRSREAVYLFELLKPANAAVR